VRPEASQKTVDKPNIHSFPGCLSKENAEGVSGYVNKAFKISGIYSVVIQFSETPSN